MRQNAKKATPQNHGVAHDRRKMSGETQTGGNLYAVFTYVTLTTVRVHLFQIASFFRFLHGYYSDREAFRQGFFQKRVNFFPHAYYDTQSLSEKYEKNAFGGLLFEKTVLQYNAYLPVAQLDSASDSDSEGRRFESCRVGQ